MCTLCVNTVQKIALHTSSFQTKLHPPPPHYKGLTTEYTQSGNGRFLLSIMIEKLAQAGEGGGMHAHPLLLWLPSRTKLQCTVQLRGQIPLR